MSDAQTVTVLFTDMVGSTALLARLGDETFDELRRAHAAVWREAVDAHDGTEVKSTGDGVMAVFPSASDAVSGAVAMQQHVARLNARRPDQAAGVRVGISVGDATAEDGDWFGVPVVEAARLCDLAGDGEILATEVVRVLAGNRGGHQFDSLGARELKGLAGPLSVCVVRWAPAANAVAPLPALFSFPEPFPFAGRTRAAKTLREAWDATLAGEHRTVLIAGEPGVGKTRLVGELAREVHKDGVIVLAGRCDAEVQHPFGPWAEALDHLVRHAESDVLAKHVERWGGTLLELVPALARYGEVPPPDDVHDPDGARRRMFTAAIDLIDAQATRTPLVLVIDDLHWADAPSLLLLRTFAQHRGAGRALVVGTYRDTDLDRTHPLAAILADFRREPGVERIALHGLEGDELVDYLALAGGRELTDDGIAFAHQLAELTAGNPFFVGEMLRHLAETNALVQHEGRWIAGPVDPSGSGVPEGVREVIGRRLSALDEQADRILGIAAVLGSEFDLATLAAVAELSDAEVLSLLDEGTSRSLLTEERGRFGVYRFAHALVRQTLLEELSSTRRIHLHRAIATVLATSQPGQVELTAHHYCEAAVAGVAAEACDWAARAAARAVSQRAYEAATYWYSRALEAEALLDVDESRRTGLLLARGQALSATDSLSAKPDLLAVADRARAADDSQRFAEAALAYGGMTGVWDQLDDPRREPLIREALELLSGDDSPTRVRLLLKMRDALQLTPATEEQRNLCTEATAMARRLDDADLLVEALARQFENARGSAGIAERVAWLAELDAVGARGPTAQFWQVLNRVLLHRLRGELDAARDATEPLDELGRRAGILDYSESFWLSEAVTRGHFDEAEVIAEQMGARTLGDLAWLVPAAARILVAAWCDGIGGTISAAEEFKARFPEMMALYAVDAGIALAAGDLDRAENELARSVELLPFVPTMLLEHVAMTLARNLVLTKNAASALPVLAALEPLDERRGMWFVANLDGLYGPAEYTIGALQLAAGEHDEAIAWLREAVDSSERAGAPPWAADSRMLLAEALHASGDRDGARAEAARAAEQADALGMRYIAERARALL